MRLAASLPTPGILLSGLAVLLTVGTGGMAADPASAQSAASPAATYAFKTVDNPADPTFNQLLGINNIGDIAGYYGSSAPGHPNKGYLLRPPYKPTNYASENYPGSVQTQVTGLNGKDISCGFWVDGKNTNHGFVDVDNKFTSYVNPGTPKKNGAVNQLLGINDAGIAVGFYNDDKGRSHAYTVDTSNGTFTDLSGAGHPVPGPSALATGINNNGAIVGFYTNSSGDTISFLLVNGKLTSFQFPGGADTMALGINKEDQIVGSYLDGSGVMHGFILSNPLGTATWQTIDNPNGVGSTVVQGINDAGKLVGFYTDNKGNVNGFIGVKLKP